MSSAMMPHTRPSTPHSGPSWSDGPQTHGLLSPAHSIDGQIVPGQHQNAESPFRRFWLDWLELRREHPTRELGLDILQDLSDVSVTPNAPYPAHRHLDPRRTVDLGLMTRADIKALKMDPSPVVADLRTDRARDEQPLLDGDDVRQAVYSGQPIILRVKAQHHGLRSARLNVPHYIIEHLGRTVVGGEGSFYTKLPAYYSDVILTQTAGRSMLVTFPQTPENAALSEVVPSLAEQRQWIRWAVRQPGVSLRILLPGDSAFLPRDHIRFAMCLGHGETRYSATAQLYVAHHRVKDDKVPTHGHERRTHHAPKPYDRPASTPRRESAGEAGLQSQPSPVPQPSGSRELHQASRAGYAARASPPPIISNNPAPQESGGRQWPPTNSPNVDPRPPHHHEPYSPPRGQLAPAARAEYAAHAPPAPSASDYDSSVVLHPGRTTPSPTYGRSHSLEAPSDTGAQTSNNDPVDAEAASPGRSLWDRIDKRNLHRRY